MSNLKALWKGQMCQIRVDGCTGKAIELAHLRMPGVTGTGLKSKDWLGAWACRSCHNKTESNPNMREAFFEGMARTQDQLMKQGLIEIKVVGRK